MTSILLYNPETNLQYLINNVEEVYAAETYTEVFYKKYTAEDGEYICAERIPVKDYPEYVIVDSSDMRLTGKLADAEFMRVDSIADAWE